MSDPKFIIGDLVTIKPKNEIKNLYKPDSPVVFTNYDRLRGLVGEIIPQPKGVKTYVITDDSDRLYYHVEFKIPGGNVLRPQHLKEPTQKHWIAEQHLDLYIDLTPETDKVFRDILRDV
jgi:hypothetical protein